MNTYRNNTSVFVDNVSLSWKNQKILNNISIKVQTGQNVSIIGPSGCGKSSLLHIIAGLVNPSHGDIYLDNINCTGKSGVTGYMQQKDVLFPWKTVLENTALPLILTGVKKEEALKEASSFFQDFGLNGFQNYLPKELSGGMKQRAALLRTHMMKKDTLLLDEPFGALDSLTRKSMQIWLLKMCTTIKSSILLVTHDIEEAIFLSDEIIILSSLPGTIINQFHVKTPRQNRTENFYIDSEMTNLKMKILSTYI
ncbi:MAG: ABC transporter ATP-binding protein [Caldisericia bacterium]|nr:ABC transporter ATP-binding protein [Caldisericia bacterium]